MAYLVRRGASSGHWKWHSDTGAVLCHGSETLLDPNQAALGGESPGGLVLRLDDQFTDNINVKTSRPQFIAWKQYTHL